MQLRTVALSGAVFLLSAGAQAQTVQPASQPVAASLATMSAGMSSAQAMLQNGTSVSLRLLERLTTEGKNLRAGDRFRLETAEAVTVGGQVVIPAGSPAMGEITEVRNKGMWGRSGKLNGRILYVVANGRQIRMTGQLGDKGKSGTAGAIASVALAGLATGFFVTGTSATLPVGTTVRGFVDEDVALTIMPTTPGLVVATAAVVTPAGITAQVPATPAITPVAARILAPANVAAPASMPLVVAPAVTPAVASVAFAPSAPPAYASAPAAAVPSVRLVPAAFAVQPIGSLSPSARRYAQREEYIRLTGPMGMAPAAAMAEVERKYGIPLE